MVQIVKERTENRELLAVLQEEKYLVSYRNEVQESRLNENPNI